MKSVKVEIPALKIITDEVRNTLIEGDENYLISITGKPGKGKSGSALTIAKMIDPDFTVDNIVFTKEEFLQKLTEKKFAPGSVIVWDEAGVDRSSYESQTKKNVSMNKVIQTFRYLRLCVMYTTPHEGYIIKNDRILFHVNLTMLSKDKPRNRAIAMWRYLDFNPQGNNGQGKTYRKAPRIIYNGKKYMLKTLCIPHPEPGIWQAYKNRERAYKRKIQLQALKDQEEKKEHKDNRVYDSKKVKKAVKIVQKDAKKFMNTRGRLDVSKICYKFNIGMEVAKQIRAAFEMEG